MNLSDSEAAALRVAKAIEQRTDRIVLVKKSKTGKYKLVVPGVGYFKTSHAFKRHAWTFVELGKCGRTFQVEQIADCVEIVRKVAREHKV